METKSTTLQERIARVLPGRRLSAEQLEALARVVDGIASAMAEGVVRATREGLSYDD